MSSRFLAYLVAGARPNFAKIAPLWRHLTRDDSPVVPQIVHTGQHYDHALSQVFLDQFGLPEPDYHLQVGSGSHGAQTGQAMTRFEELVLEARPDMVVVVGDVNSTLATALVAVKLGIPIAHVEAGLRSFDFAMPEEVNRVLTDRISDLLFASEPSALENLKNEGIPAARQHLVGNIMIDSLVHSLPRIRASRAMERLSLVAQRFAVATVHRPSNVDSEGALRKLLQIMQLAAARAQIIWPIHPRTAKTMEAFGLEGAFRAIPKLEIIEPLGYFEFMNLVENASFLLTDSGGIQGETTWLGVPCITLRDSTEQPVTLSLGTNTLAGLDPEKVSAALDAAASFTNAGYRPPPLWDGRVAERIGSILETFLQA